MCHSHIQYSMHCFFQVEFIYIFFGHLSISHLITITHLLEKNLVTTYEAEKILWALLRSVYLYEVEEGKRSKYEIVDMIEAQRQLLLKEFSRMEDVGDG
jgi:hypothetical protein